MLKHYAMFSLLPKCDVTVLPCAGAATADGADLGRGGRVTVRAAAIGHSGLAAHNSDSDTPESAGASADERSGGAGGVHNSADELGDSAESAGLSGDDEAHDDRLMQAGPRRGQSGAGAPAGQVSAGRKRKRPVTAAGELDDDDETAFSDGEEAPLMSPEGVAAATAGLEEPSSEDDDDDDDEQEGGGGGAGRLGAWGGRLAEAGDSDDSDAEDDGAPPAHLTLSRRLLSCSRVPPSAYRPVGVVHWPDPDPSRRPLAILCTPSAVCNPDFISGRAPFLKAAQVWRVLSLQTRTGNALMPLPLRMPAHSKTALKGRQ